MHHPSERDDRDVPPRSNDRRAAEFDFVVFHRDVTLRRQDFAVFEKHHRVVAPQRMLHQSLCVVGVGRHDDSQAGDLSVHRVVAAGMVRRRRVTDADAASQQDGHLQATARHVLHLGDLVHDFADRVEDEVGKHEVDHRPRPRHRRAACESHKTSFRDGSITQPLGPVEVVQPGRRLEVAAANPDPLTHDEDARVDGHLLSECLVSRLREGDVARLAG